MRVAYVCADPGVPVFGSKGCSIHVQAVLAELANRGARVELFTPRPGGSPVESLETVRVHQLPDVGRGDVAQREQRALATNEALRFTLQQEGPFDLVYERYALWSYAGQEYARAEGIPSVLEVNAPLIREQTEHRELIDRLGAELATRRAFRAAGALVAVSKGVAEAISPWLDDEHTVHVVPNGVDVRRFLEASDLPHIAPDGEPSAADAVESALPFTVGFVGSLKPWHGLEHLIAAFGILHRRHPEARLLLVGDGPERERIERELDHRSLRSASHLTGAVAPHEVPRWMRRMHVGVAPYPALERFYFSPLKIMEYMAAGLPAVASAIGQIPEVVEHGRTGLLVPPGDPPALAEALDRIRMNAPLGRQLGRAGRQRALAEHSWEAAVTHILHIAARAAPAQVGPR